MKEKDFYLNYITQYYLGIKISQIYHLVILTSLHIVIVHLSVKVSSLVLYSTTHMINVKYTQFCT